MATISSTTIVTLVDTQTNSGTIVLPKTSDIPYRAILFKDLYGTFDTKSLTLNTQSPDLFEDGTSVKTFNDKFTYLTLYADTSHSKWLILNGTQNNSITVSTLNGVQTGYISSLNVNSLTFANGNGWLDLTALRAILVSTIQLDASIGNFSSISGNGSQIVALNAISSLSLQSTIVGLGTFGYLSTNIVPSTIVGLGTFGYISSLSLQSTIVGLGTFGYLSTNTVPSTIVGLATFGYLSTNTVPSTIEGLGTFGYLSTNIVPSTIQGLGTFGYISSTQLRSTVSGLGNIYMSTFNGSTTFLSTAVGFISSLTVNSLTVGSGLGYVDFGAIRAVIVSSIQTNTGLLFASSLTGDGSQIYNLNAISSQSLQSTVTGLGTFGYLSTNTVPSTIQGLGTFGYLSTNTVPSTIVGLGTFGYLSTNTVPSTIEGLGSFGYISSTQLTSTVVGLGNIYLSTFTGSTNFISSGQGFISSLNVNSLTFTSGNGWLDLTALRAILVSTIQLDAAVGNFSSISGNGSQIVALNAISSLSLQSTVVGLGTFGYLSTNIVPSTIEGLGTFGYISSTQLTSTIEGLGTFGYLSTNTVPSTIVGLGTFGYISSTQLTSTIEGLGTFGYLSTNTVPSTIEGLGTFGYLSTNTVPSTIVGLGTFGYLSTFTGSTNFISSGQGFISSLNVNSLTFTSGNGWLDLTALRAILVSTIQLDASIGNFSSISGNGSQIVALNAISSLSLQSTIVGLGTFGYLSTNTVPSTIVGLGTFGYISSTQLTSTIIGLGTFGYLSTNTVPSTIVGLGTFGYISSTQLTSTIIGLGTFGYLSTNTVPSTIEGLGTFGYISSTQLTSTIIGLGTFGYLSSFNSISSLNISSGNIFTNRFTTNSISTVNISSASNYTSVQFANSYNGLTLGANINMNASVFPTSGAVGKDLGGSGNFRWNNFWVSTISSIHVETSTINVQNTITAFNISTNNITGFNLLGTTILSTQQIFCSSLQIGPTDAILDILGPIRTQDMSTITCQASTITANTITLNRIFGGSLVANGTTTQNLNPFTIAAQIGFGSNTGGLGFYSEGHFRSTFTQLIQPTQDNDGFSNVIFMRGNVSTQNQLASSITTNILFASSNVSTQVFVGSNCFVNTLQTYNTSRIAASFIHPVSDFSPGFGYEIGSATNRWIRSYQASTITSVIMPLNTGITPTGIVDINSTVRVLGTLSTMNINTSTITGGGSGLFNLNAISSLSLQSTVVGLGTFGYLSTNIVPSTIVGLGTFGYLSTNIVPSTIEGLGTFGYFSSLSNWAQYNAIQNIDVSENEIINVEQTNNIYSGATNLIARRLSHQTPANIAISKTSFTNVLDTTIKINYNNLYNTYTTLNCTFSFSCDTDPDDLAYYFTLSNVAASDESVGKIFSATYPYIEDAKNFYPTNRSITVQDQFSVSPWTDAQQFYPLMYVIANSNNITLSNMKFSMVYEPMLT